MLRAFAPIPPIPETGRYLHLNRFSNVVDDHFLEGAPRMSIRADHAVEGHDWQAINRGLEVSGVQWASSKNVAEAVLSRRPGVLEVGPIRWRRPPRSPTIPTNLGGGAGRLGTDCGYHCAGQSVPEHICDPLAEPAAHAAKHDHLQAGHQMLPMIITLVINT